MNINTFFAFISTLALTGCAVGPDYRAPDMTTQTQWSAGVAESESTEALKNWWQDFHDPVLNQLIQQAIDGNYDLQIASQRIQVAQDAVKVADAAGLPQIGFGGAAEDRRETQTLDWPKPPASLGSYAYYQLGFNASWELDLFGETKRRRESAQAAADAVLEDRRRVLISLSAAVASNYASYRATEARLQIANENLNVAQRSEKLARRTFEAGQQSHLNVSEAEARVHAIEAAIPSLQAQAENLVHAIAILLGKTPVEFDRAQLQGDAIVPAAPALPPSLPSEVIARRPDIRRAERDYAQSNANVGIAVASLYPKFSIPLSLGPTTSQFHEAFRAASMVARVGLHGSESLYTGGKLTAQVDAAKAGKDASLLNYRLTVIKAFGEVEDALTNQAAEQQRQRALNAEVAARQTALEEARKRFRVGQVGNLPVLDSQRDFYAARDAQVLSSLAQCLASISLYKSIGGGWDGIEISELASTAP